MKTQPGTKIEPHDQQQYTGDSQTMERMKKTSPRAKGRITGAFYLAIFVAGEIFMTLIPSTGLLNNNDDAAIDYIVSHQTAFWAGYPFLLLVVTFRRSQHCSYRIVPSSQASSAKAR